MLPEYPEYIGGDVAPADLWGRAPIRFEFAKAIEAFVMHKSLLDEQWTACDLVDDLIAKELIPNELEWGHDESRSDVAGRSARDPRPGPGQ